MDIDELLSRLSALIPQDVSWKQEAQAGRGNFRCEACVACEDCKFCRDCQQCERCTYCEGCEGCQSCTQCRRCFACAGSSYLEDCRICRDSSYLLLCLDCENCVHCLGCVGLSGAEFCVLNEQLSRKDYFAQVSVLRETLAAKVAQGWRVDQLAPCIGGVRPNSVAAMPRETTEVPPTVARVEEPATICDPVPARESTPQVTGSVSRPGPTQPQGPASPPRWMSQLQSAQAPRPASESIAPSRAATAHVSPELGPATTSQVGQTAQAREVEQEVQRLAQASSRSFEARLARLGQTPGSRPSEPPPSTPRGPLDRWAPPNPALSQAQGTPRQGGTGPALGRLRTRSMPSERPVSTARSGYERHVPNEEVPPRRRALPSSRGPGSWRLPEAGARPDSDARVGPGLPPRSAARSAWVPRSAKQERAQHLAGSQETPSTPNRLLAFVKSGAASLPDQESAEPGAWAKASLPPRKRR